MAEKFITAHAGAKKAEAKVNDIFSIKQSFGEGLRDFLALFNHVRMTLTNVPKGMAVAAFKKGLSRSGLRATKKLMSRLMKYHPTTWDEIHNAYCAEVRADEDDLNGPTQRLISVQMESKKDRRNDSRRDLSGSRPNRERHQPYVRGTLMPPPHHDKEIVYALEKLGTKVKWPQKMKSDPSTRKSNALFEFHQEWGHKTEDCIALRQEVVDMVHQGNLKELMSERGRANFARGWEQHQGGDDASISSVKFTTTHKLKRSITHEQYDELEESIIFDKLDTHGLVFPHYDALVITLRVFDTKVRCIMVDDGSSACIIHPRVLTQMKLEDKIVPRCITLTFFNNAVVRTSREIKLPILVGGVTLETTFHIVDQDTAYNAIIGRPWIHAMKAVPSSLYQVIKLPTS
ncbi:PREDICTED: uncharacterized protein LOC109206893 [Nicotiana attenuata]|uniref:uncharacterized protein LOC109206893 n=1 Tax=Nicotiana attenuata TaxID=49451 RepID=UPI000905BD37|nr:PREDICTED: uncharacterized protein LOC109206893 [Nicotiana attenuata]